MKQRKALHGWLVLDKPPRISSAQALAKARRLLEAEKAGHGGTLDPLASGVLPLAFGEATKTVSYAMDGPKTYRFTVQWGVETTTDDLEGEITSKSGYVASQYDVERVIPNFIGAVRQVPPSYSALKVSGQRAYQLARAGETVLLSDRRVNIDSLIIESHDPRGSTTFVVRCGKGTYVRSIARDLGRAIGCLGHVTFLRRLKVGPFQDTDAISLEMLEEIVHRPASENSLSGVLRPIDSVLDGIPAWPVVDSVAARLQQGQRVLLPEAKGFEGAEAVLITHAEKPLGLFRVENGVLKTLRQFKL